jgi:predicted phosphodiesterase
MARVAILADIHGNLPAFEAVLADLRDVAPDEVVVNGDIINRGPQSKECLQIVRESGWHVTYGNHEDYVLKGVRRDDLPPEWDTDWFLPVRSVSESLNPDEIAYISALPWSHVIDVPGLPAVHVTHGSPRALNDGLGPWYDDADLLDALSLVPQRVIVGAHSHRPFDHHVDGHWALNCGSVGDPFNGNPAAQYLVLTGQGGAWQADFRAIPYDRERTYAAWNITGYMERSMSAQVFKLEVETATFHLLAYERFCAKHELPKNEMRSFQRYRRAAAMTPPGRVLVRPAD